VAIWWSFEPAAGIRVQMAATEAGLCCVSVNAPEAEFLARLRRRQPDAAWRRSGDDALLGEAAVQLRAYFRGELRRFELPLDLGGSAFQRAVWEALQRIPYGETSTYGQIAVEIGRPSAVRAVGRANGANPVAIIVPCHRVIASGGALGGYAWGVELKRFLLDLEKSRRGG